MSLRSLASNSSVSDRPAPLAAPIDTPSR